MYSIVQGVLLSILLFYKSRKIYSLRWLGLLVLVFSYLTWVSTIYWSHRMMEVPHVLGSLSPVMFLLGPLFYLFIQDAISYAKKSSAHILCHTIPAVVTLLINIPLYVLSAEDKIHKLQNYSPTHWEYLYSTFIEPCFFILSAWAYGITTYYSYGSYLTVQKWVSRWFKWLHICYFLLISSLTSYYVLVWSGLLQPWMDYGIIFIMLLMIVTITVLGFNQESYFNENNLPKPVEQATPEKIPVAQTPGEQVLKSKYRMLKELEMELNKQMELQKWYTDPQLSLDQLSKLVHTNRHDLSLMFNKVMNKKYYDYINELRITQACQLLTQKTKTEKNVIEIAFEVGYPNKATFNSVFKKLKGMTPTEYRKSMRTLPMKEPSRI